MTIYKVILTTGETPLLEYSGHTETNHHKIYLLPLSGCGIKYGYLYNWYAVDDARNIAAADWHVPTAEDMWNLHLATGYEYPAGGGSLKETGTTYWYEPNTSATNEFGFNARGAGRRLKTGVFESFKNLFQWHSTWDYEADFTVCSQINYNSDNFFPAESVIYKKQGNSIRLIKDDDTLANYTGNDGKIYNSVKIGSQIWMAENLAETEYRDHSRITIIEDAVLWSGQTTGAMCAYDNDYTNVGCGEVAPVYANSIYGLLYNWYAVNDARNIAAADWHVPTKTEFETLIAELGGLAGLSEKIRETGVVYWKSPNTGATNSSGYSMRGSGHRIYNTGVFTEINDGGYSMSITGPTYPWVLYANVGNTESFQQAYPNEGLPIRLIKDDGNLANYIDNNGYIYQTVKIGDQVWVAENLKTTKYRNGDTISEVTGDAEWSALTTGALCAYDNDWDNV